MIYTDSACDMGKELLKKWDVRYESLTFQFDDSGEEYGSMDMPADEFYGRMRAGNVAKTSAVNMQTFYDGFKRELAAGKDILYIGMSGGISNTPNAASIAGDELKAEYPDRKIITIDTLTASIGEGYLVYKAVEMKKEGKSIEEIADYIYDNMQKVNLWFIVDDLIYLKRGGRISAAAAFAGGVLQLKPVLRVDPEGKLENMQKVRGRSQSIRTLVKLYGERALDRKGEYVICHASCPDEAKGLEKQLKDAYGVGATFITEMSPVIGAHTGPGAMVLVFFANER